MAGQDLESIWLSHLASNGRAGQASRHPIKHRSVPQQSSTWIPMSTVRRLGDPALERSQDWQSGSGGLGTGAAGRWPYLGIRFCSSSQIGVEVPSDPGTIPSRKLPQDTWFGSRSGVPVMSLPQRQPAELLEIRLMELPSITLLISVGCRSLFLELLCHVCP